MSLLISSCISCAAEESLDVILMRMFEDGVVRQLVLDLAQISLPLSSTLFRYIRLQAPEKQRQRMSQVSASLMELIPDMKRRSIERNGRVWMLAEADWQGAFDAVFTAVDKGTLLLPIKGNGYLYGVLLRKAEKAEGDAEAQREAERRSGPRRDTVTVRGQVMGIGEALSVVHGNVDPALAKLNAEAPILKTMPAGFKEKFEEIRKKTISRNT